MPGRSCEPLQTVNAHQTTDGFGELFPSSRREAATPVAGALSRRISQLVEIVGHHLPFERAVPGRMPSRLRERAMVLKRLSEDCSISNSHKGIDVIKVRFLSGSPAQI
jgi:hypothetical protein